MKKQFLLNEHFTTLITLIKVFLNSILISALSTNAKYLNVLSQGHFLIGLAINLIPDLNSNLQIVPAISENFSKCRLPETSFGKKGIETTLSCTITLQIVRVISKNFSKCRLQETSFGKYGMETTLSLGKFEEMGKLYYQHQHRRHCIGCSGYLMCSRLASRSVYQTLN